MSKPTVKDITSTENKDWELVEDEKNVSSPKLTTNNENSSVTRNRKTVEDEKNVSPSKLTTNNENSSVTRNRETAVTPMAACTGVESKYQIVPRTMQDETNATLLQELRTIRMSIAALQLEVQTLRQTVAQQEELGRQQLYYVSVEIPTQSYHPRVYSSRIAEKSLYEDEIYPTRTKAYEYYK